MSNIKHLSASELLKTGHGRLRGIFCASASGSPSVRVGDAVNGNDEVADKATGVLTLTGAIVPGSHAESVLTSNATLPAVLTKAAKALTFSNVVHEAETITIGSRVYEIDSDNSVIGAHVKVDVSAGTKTQAAGVLTLDGVVIDGETFTVGSEIFEFDTDGIVVSGHKKIDISSFAVAAQGLLTLGGAKPGNTETITIGTRVYTWKTTLTAAVDEILIGLNVDDCIDNLVAALNHTGVEGTQYSTGTVINTQVTATKDSGTAMTLTAKVPGLAGSSIATTTTMADGANIFDSTTLGVKTEGVDCTAVNADGQIVSDFNTLTALDITAAQGTGTSVNFSADTPGAQNGSAGNVVSTETMAHGSFATGTFTGGSEATAAEASTALIAAITGDTAVVLVNATSGGAGVTNVEAKTGGVAGNSIALAETCANATWAAGATALSGGLDADTVTIGSTVYTFVSALSVPAVAYEVMVGANAAEALDNLKSAINGSAGIGVAYSTGTVKHPDVVATDNAATTQKIVARVPGTAANTIATTETSSYLTWADTTLGGGTGTSTPGVAPETVTIGIRVYSFVDVLSETNGADAIVDQVLFGANSAAALDNLKLAITHGSTEGTEYSTGTVVNALVTATTNTDTEQTLEALVAGTGGNSIATETDIANGSFAETTLTGGLAANKVMVNTFTPVAGTFYPLGGEDGVDFTVGLYITVVATCELSVIFD
jgi:hypothetical protein